MCSCFDGDLKQSLYGSYYIISIIIIDCAVCVKKCRVHKWSVYGSALLQRIYYNIHCAGDVSGQCLLTFGAHAQRGLQ